MTFSRGETGLRWGHRSRVGLWVVALVALLVVSPNRMAAQGKSSDASEFVGEYGVSIEGDDLPISLGLGSNLEGSWRIVFGEGGDYSAARQDLGTLVSGTYEVSGDEVTITDEGGLLSCANPQPDGEPAPTATYAWEKTGDLLRLEPVEEGCRLRQALLSTRPLSPFIACVTTPFDLTGEATGDDSSSVGSGNNAILDDLLGDGTPEASPESEATPEAEATSEVEATPAEIGTADDPTEAITDLLAQLTACWVTGDPTLVLPLFSPGFLDEATGNGAASLDDLADQFRQLQTVPIVWELAGEVETDDDTASAVVAVAFAGEEQLQTFEFERGDDGWRLANFGE